jgi:hypothetical protein
MTGLTQSKFTKAILEVFTVYSKLIAQRELVNRVWWLSLFKMKYKR